MAPFSPRALNPWRTLACAVARAARRAATVAGAAAALIAGDAAAGTPAAAAPAAAASAIAAATAAAPAAKPVRKSRRKASSAAKARPAKAKKSTARPARRSSSRTTSRARSSRSRRTTETPAAPSIAAIEVPAVDLPDLALAADTATASAAFSWEAALGAAPSTAPAPAQPAAGRLTAFSRSATSLLDGLVARARSQLGTRYVYGGANPGNALDCSSFVRYVMEALDVRLPRTANQQARVGRPVPRDPAQLRPGDLLTFGRGRHTSHVGIYLGEGRFIHASVKSGQVIETTIERNRSLFRRWQGARRLLAAADSLDSDLSGGG